MTCKDEWSDSEALKFIERYKKKDINEDLALRTYSSRLLGSNPELVLHGGGNTSVKSFGKNIFGETIPLLYVKGSGWDLSTIEPQGHPGVSFLELKSLKKLKKLSDEDMVASQRKFLVNSNSPNPSVETLLHAFLPHKFIDHTHSIAVLAIANQENSQDIIKNIYGDNVVIVPYIMPGFQLAIEAEKCYVEAQDRRKNIEIEGMILLNHGIFSFGNTAQESYQRMIKLVNKAESFIPRKINLNLIEDDYSEMQKSTLIDVLPLIRGLVGRISIEKQLSNNWILESRITKQIKEIISKNNFEELIKRGVATPDHVIRTKSAPLYIDNFPLTKRDNLDWLVNLEKLLRKYIEDYEDYFSENNQRVGFSKTQLDPIPRLIFIKGVGMISLGKTKKNSIVNADIGEAWVETVLASEEIGSFSPVNASDTFDLEYWSLEQAKLSKNIQKLLSGKIVAISGAGGVIGREIALLFAKNGAEIVSLDLDYGAAKETAKLCGSNALALKCDVTKKSDVLKTMELLVLEFGGLDILISNAGKAFQGLMSEIEEDSLKNSMNINFFSHQFLSNAAINIFRLQDLETSSNLQKLGGQLLFNISKQSLNPGPKFGAYGIAKSALLSLMRQYALEEGENRIRSNGINADRIKSGLLNNDLITSRSKARGISEEAYMSGNLLKSEVLASDVAKAFFSLALMEKT